MQSTGFQRKVWTVDISGAEILFDNALEEEGGVAIRGKRAGVATFRAETIEEFD